MNYKFVKYRTLFTVTFIVTSVYILWRIFFTVPTMSDGILAVILGVFLVSMEFLGTLEMFDHYYNLSSIFIPDKPTPPQEWYPDVDIFIATYSEPNELLQKTINGCLNMDYIDKSKVHIYICDDKRRPEVRALCETMGVNYITRPDNKDAKAGNYNNALAHTSSPLIATFDADMIPRNNFLLEMVPYFYIPPEEQEENKKKNKEKKIGFVQAPQAFYNPDLFQYNLYSEARIPDEQDYFFRDVQTARNKSNSVIYAGSNTVLSREALDAAGGFFRGVITEDFATGLMIQKRGYTTYAIPTVLASGLAPGDLESLITQRRRWARGCIQTLFKFKFLIGSGLNFAAKCAYWGAFSYWYASLRRLSYVISPIAFAVFNIVVVKCTIYEVLIFAFPTYFLQDYSLKKLSGNIRNSRLSILYETILFPSLLPSIIMETFGISEKKFKVTRKDGGGTNNMAYQFKQAIPHIVFSLFSMIGIIKCIMNIFATGQIFYLVIIFWLVINFYATFMAVLFMLGREIKRTTERFIAAIPCEVSWSEGKYSATTVDISEKGFSFILAFPYYLPDDIELDATLKTDRYESKVKCKIVNVSQVEAGYKYAAYIVKAIDFDNQNQLYSVVYDREPTLPSQLDASTSLFDDFVTNLQRRIPKQEYMNRKLPRIPLNLTIDAAEQPGVHIVNFNYTYLLIDKASLSEIWQQLSIPLTQSIVMQCTLANAKMSNGALYRIDNVNEFAQDPEFLSLLGTWLGNAKVKQVRKHKEVISDEFDERANL